MEAKYIEVDEKQSAIIAGSEPIGRTKFGKEERQALISVHRTLLSDHHDIFLASQHPAASPALTRLAAKYNMPARMWRHDIHAYLEVLRHWLPESLDHMLAFIYIAYSMMALLYEKVPAFEDTWIECLGDLGRYRMALEEDGVRDLETWSGVSRLWCSKAADKSPHVGRLCHHLAILARPFTLQQLSLYIKSLTCVLPFRSVRGSILILFNPELDNANIDDEGPTLELSSIDRPRVESGLGLGHRACDVRLPYPRLIRLANLFRLIPGYRISLCGVRLKVVFPKL